MIVELSGARWTGATDVQAALPEPATIALRPERVTAVLGLEVPDAEEILGRIGFERVEAGSIAGKAGGYRVPTWRARDVTREIDLVEEVARFRMDEIPFTLPRRDVTFGRLTPWQRARRVVEDALVGCGFAETYTPTFAADGDYRLPEPLSSEAAALRTALAPSLVAAARQNVAWGNSGIALFEIARVYPRGGALPDERWHVAGVVEGRIADAAWAVEQIYGALKIVPAVTRGAEPLLHPGKAAQTAEGWFGELHPTALEGTWGAFELDLDALAAGARAAVAYSEVSPYPEVRQDLAFVVDDGVPAGELLDALREAGGPELREVRVFDEYRGAQVGEGKRSLAFRAAFGSAERTLTDEDAGAVRARIVAALSARFGAVLRA